jgi:hypothetical protein
MLRVGLELGQRVKIFLYTELELGINLGLGLGCYGCAYCA